jgi:hypothetical protein
MKRDAVVDRFYRRGYSQKRIVFQLIKDSNGKFQIQREGFTLIFFSKEEQARIGFETLKGGRGASK